MKLKGKLDKSVITNILKIGIERNFGGNEEGVHYIKKCFTEQYKNLDTKKFNENTSTIELIKENLACKNSR